MSNQSNSSTSRRASVRPHASHDANVYAVQGAGGGIPIQCQYCVGQSFRRSRLRTADLKHLFFQRYPVRCLRCGQRQSVSFTLAGISVPSHVKQRRARKDQQAEKYWASPMKESLRPKPLGEAPEQPQRVD